MHLFLVNSLRLGAGSGFIYLFYFFVENILAKDYLLACKFLTLLNVAYLGFHFIMNVFLSTCNKPRATMTMTNVAMTISFFVMVSFWTIYTKDPKLLMTKDIKVPDWINHATHTAPFAAVALESILHHPSKPYFFTTFFMGLTLAGGYIGFLEYLITKENFYVYPFLKMFDRESRHKFFGVCIGGIIVALTIIYLFLAFIRSDHKGLSKAAAKKAQKKKQKKQD